MTLDPSAFQRLLFDIDRNKDGGMTGSCNFWRTQCAVSRFLACNLSCGAKRAFGASPRRCVQQERGGPRRLHAAVSYTKASCLLLNSSFYFYSVFGVRDYVLAIDANDDGHIHPHEFPSHLKNELAAHDTSGLSRFQFEQHLVFDKVSVQDLIFTYLNLICICFRTDS
jgi:hypothetical protein